MSRVPLVLLAPIVLLQGRRVRRSVPHLTPPTQRSGGSRAAGALRLLVLGDSTAVGSGVDQMPDAVAGQIAKRRAEPVAWRVVGTSGFTSAEVREQHLAEALAAPCDLAVLLVGWNDALQLRSARAFGTDLAALLAAIGRRNPAARIVVVGPPTFGTFAVYPQPLRWALGAHARGLGATARRVAAQHGAHHVDGFDGVRVASDRFHPDAAGYGELAERIVAALR